MATESGATTSNAATSTSMKTSTSLSSTCKTSEACSPPSKHVTTPSPKTDGKPIKLRAACNHCFSAKVRCDGNKEGCRRCSEKKLSCVYSESRVGKVVGKRRKRPIDDSIGTINSASWIVNNTVPIQSIPSPATTHRSDESAKSHCHIANWSAFPAGVDAGYIQFDEATESLNALEMADNRSYSMASDLTFFTNSGLPTPALSPPEYTRYLSPGQLEPQPTFRQVSYPVEPSKLHPQHYPWALSRNVDHASEDEETVCIKLLAHLKKHSANDSQPRECQVDMLKKSNATVRRLLRSQTIQSDYACHLLLSSIINHLVLLCERLCQGPADDPYFRSVEAQFLQEQPHFDSMSTFVDVSQVLPPTEHGVLTSMVQEVMAFTAVVGEFLKRRPLHGFQHLGRHECFHVELEQRLKHASILLQP